MVSRIGEPEVTVDVITRTTKDNRHAKIEVKQKLGKLVSISLAGVGGSFPLVVVRLVT